MRGTRLIIGLLIATAVAVVGARLYLEMVDDRGAPPTTEQKERSAKDVARQVVTGEFTLTDHRGNSVTDVDYRGSWLLIFFGYTHCPDVCPTTLGVVALVMDELGADAAKVKPIFISVDPDRDSPESLADYVAAFHPSIDGLTGTPEQVKAAAHTHRAYYAKAPSEEGGEITADDYAVDHSAYLYLMDPDGVYAHVFSPTDTPEEIAASVKDFIQQQ